MQHTSCALSLNENWDEDVRKDMSDALDKIVVEDKVRNLSSCFFWMKGDQGVVRTLSYYMCPKTTEKNRCRTKSFI